MSALVNFTAIAPLQLSPAVSLENSDCNAVHIICDYIQRLLNYGAYTSWVQNKLILAQNWHDPLTDDNYHSKSLLTFSNKLSNSYCHRPTHQPTHRPLHHHNPCRLCRHFHCNYSWDCSQWFNSLNAFAAFFVLVFSFFFGTFCTALFTSSSFDSRIGFLYSLWMESLGIRLRELAHLT